MLPGSATDAALLHAALGFVTRGLKHDGRRATPIAEIHELAAPLLARLGWPHAEGTLVVAVRARAEPALLDAVGQLRHDASIAMTPACHGTPPSHDGTGVTTSTTLLLRFSPITPPSYRSYHPSVISCQLRRGSGRTQPSNRGRPHGYSGFPPRSV